MKLSIKSYIVLFAAFTSLISCTKDVDPSTNEKDNIEVQVKVNLVHNGEAYDLGDTLYDVNGFDIVLSRFKFYMSEIKFTDAQDVENEISEIALVNIKENETFTFSGELPKGTFKNIKLVLGLNPTLNNMNPEDFPNEHPLSIYSGMYWSMLKYRFAVVEGRANLTGSLGSSSDYFLAYHPGTDPVMKTATLNNQVTISETNNIVEFDVDLNTFFTGVSGTNIIDFQSEAQTHSADPAQINTADKVMTNLAASLKVK